MKRSMMWISVILVLCLASSPAKLQAENSVKSAGIGLRTSFWDLPGVSNRVVARPLDGEDWIDFGGTGGHIYLLSRIADRMMLELNFGSVGTIKGVHRWSEDNDFDLTAVIPMTLGIRYDLLPLHHRSGARPYLAAGAGPYIIARATVRESWFEDEVTTEWDGHKGAYLGFGVDYRLTGWLGLNLDARHHFVDLNANNDYSGTEYGIGFQFMWGRYGR
jgi:hypothetical protein